MSLDDYIRLAERLVAAAKGHDVFFFAEPNAGQPELVDDKLVYKVEPDEFSVAAERICSAGVNIIGGCCGVIGGCCGTSPSHIQALVQKLKT
jgi:methionine synthase I (cobalamin-dependent)